MQLSFAHPHLSISAFPPVEIPAFTVIIGLNGSGKSHLLQAIANGQVANSIVPTAPGTDIKNNRNIKLLGQDSSLPDIGQAYDRPPALSGPATQMGSFERIRTELLADQRAELENATDHKIAEILKPGEDVWRVGALEIAHRLGEADARRITDIFTLAEEAFAKPWQRNSRAARMNRGMRLDEMQAVTLRIAAKLGVSSLLVSLKDMEQLAPWGNTDQFSTNLSLLFGKYRDALVQNRLLRLSDGRLSPSHTWIDAGGRFASFFRGLRGDVWLMQILSSNTRVGMLTDI